MAEGDGRGPAHGAVDALLALMRTGRVEQIQAPHNPGFDTDAKAGVSRLVG